MRSRLLQAPARSLNAGPRQQRAPISRRSFTLRSTLPPADENALPLVFVTSHVASKELKATEQTWNKWSAVLASSGYRSEHIHLERSGGIEALEQELKEALAQGHNPFPPLLFARSADCLITQTYASSNPLKGLVLVSPPPSNRTARKAGWLTEDLPEFTFEPGFPLVIVEASSHVTSVRSHRLLQDWPDFVDLIETADDQLSTDETAERIMSWMDAEGL